MSANIKPEIYLSLIKQGQLQINPFIFVSLIPKPEKISADLLRKVSASESQKADLSRRIKNVEKNSADLLRNIVNAEKNFFNIERKLFSAEKFSVNTVRRIVQADNVHADTYRGIKKTEKIQADTSRKIGVETVYFDLQRIVKSKEKSISNLCRKVGGNENFYADLHLKIVKSESRVADTFRQVKASDTARVDTLIKNGVKEKFSAETKRVIANHEKICFGTLLKITVNEKISFDSFRGLRDIARADSCRQVVRSAKSIADTVIRIPYIFKYIVQSKPLLLSKTSKARLPTQTTSLVNTFEKYNVTAINITLSEKTLSDTFSVELIDETITVGDIVSIYLLDYPFDFQVEEVTYKDLIRSVKGKYCVDEQLYTWFQMPYGDDGDETTNDENPTAYEAIREIATDLGLTCNILFDNFTPTNLRRGEFVTYSDVISSLFGWTSRVANRQINIFIRGRVLYALQRGKEERDFDITDLPHSRPTVNQKFNRVLCHNPNNDSNDDSDDDKPRKFSGTVTYSNKGVVPYQNKVFVSLSYQTGLLVNEKITMQTSLYADNNGDIITHGQISDTGYSYQTWSPATSDKNNNDEPQSYLVSKKVSSTSWEQNMTTWEVTKQIVSDSTHYGYEVTQNGEELYLFHESSTVKTIKTLSDADAETETVFKDTYHFPVGNGFYAQAVYQNGIIQGANISQGTPSNRVSPYTVDQIQAIFSLKDIVEEPDDFNDQLSAIVDDSFPVQEAEFKESLNQDLRALHGKTVETVNVDLISKITDGVPEINHIIDFTETVTLNGNKYFLVSNRISFTPRKLIQTLQLIRWF